MPYMKKIAVNAEIAPLDTPYELSRRLLDVARMLENSRRNVEVKPLRVLFVGNDNDVKQAAVKVLARDFAGDIYAVDVSALISKDVGETEKKLGAVLDDAEQRGAMLFFEEADALLGKSSAASDAMQACIGMMGRCGVPIVACVMDYYQLDPDVIKRFSCVIDFYAAETLDAELV